MGVQIGRTIADNLRSLKMSSGTSFTGTDQQLDWLYFCQSCLAQSLSKMPKLQNMWQQMQLGAVQAACRSS